MYQKQFTIRTSGRGSTEITDQIASTVTQSELATGICHIFVHHTSASLMICENADPTVRSDLEAFMQRLVPDGDTLFKHIDEGVDDMPAHIRSILTQSSLSIPIIDGRGGLGTWQGIYLWEHRLRGHARQITVTCYGS